MDFRPAAASIQIQRQTLAPALIKSMQLLSLSYPALMRLLEKTTQENPFLEMNWDVYDPWPVSGSASEKERGDGDTLSLLRAEDPLQTLEGSLRLQLAMSGADEMTQRAGRYIISNLEPNGYFLESLDALSAESGISVSCLSEALTLIRSFEPAGVAANGLKDCLLRQIEPSRCDSDLAGKLLDAPARLLERQDFPALARLCGAKESELKSVLSYLAELTPYPAAVEDGGLSGYVYPDIEVVQLDGSLSFVFRSGNDAVYVNEALVSELGDPASLDRETRDYIREMRRQAEELIQQLTLRKNAVEKLMAYLLDVQREFFLSGNGRIRPVTMKQAAMAIGVNPSTISRCVSGRYIQTVDGVVSMRRLFSAGLATADGGEIAPGEIKTMLAVLIREEDRRHPLSDQQLTDKLASMQIRISRRTVAKYREQIGFPSARDRIRR